jgi:hypothetical protein
MNDDNEAPPKMTDDANEQRHPLDGLNADERLFVVENAAVGGCLEEAVRAFDADSTPENRAKLLQAVAALLVVDEDQVTVGTAKRPRARAGVARSVAPASSYYRARVVAASSSPSRASGHPGTRVPGAPARRA